MDSKFNSIFCAEQIQVPLELPEILTVSPSEIISFPIPLFFSSEFHQRSHSGTTRNLYAYAAEYFMKRAQAVSFFLSVSHLYF